jgi:hypothetical protein
MTRADWIAEGKKRFGDDMLAWRFVCPSCGHVTMVKDWQDAKAPEGAVVFSCVGRYLGADGSKSFKLKGGPCNYAGGGLFRLNPIEVIDEEGKDHHVFAFAE